MNPGTRVKLVLLAFLGLVHILVTLYATVPGRISIDEEVVHWMAKSFSETGSLHLSNGYEEFPSRELEYHLFIKPRNGRLYPVYPYLFPVLAFPFYRMAGFFGLYILNSLAFMGVVGLCFLTAKKLFKDIDLALNSCLILVTASFAWEYSQAAWPHMTSALVILSAVYLAVVAFYAAERRSSVLAALAAGVLAGLAGGIRVDGVLVLPAVILPFIFARPWRPLEATMVGIGAIPGLALLSVTNMVKFGVFSPFSYGSTWPGVRKEVVAAAAAGLLLVWLLTRTEFHRRVPGSATKFAIVAGLAFLGFLVFPHTAEMAERVFRYAYVSMVDLRALDVSADFSVMTRSPGGGVVYIDALKKAVLQSMPFLSILVIPIATIVTGGKDFSALVILSLVPLTVAGYMSYEFPSREGGGLCLNYRYFLPCLPFVAILSAYALKDLKSLWPDRLSRTATVLTCAVTAGAYLVLVEREGTSVIRLEFPLLVFPLLMAGLILACILGCLLWKTNRLRPLWTAGRILLTSAMVWSGLTAFLYDYPRHREVRVADYVIGEMVLQGVADDSIFFASPTRSPFTRLIERKSVRMAAPRLDGFKDFPRLLEFHLKAGRRAFGFFKTGVWMKLAEGPLKHHEIRPILPYDDGFVGEIVLASDPGVETGGHPDAAESPQVPGERSEKPERQKIE